MPSKRGYCVKNTRKVSNLAALFALYPRFYAIKSTYENSEYRFLIIAARQVPHRFQAAYADLPASLKGSLKRLFLQRSQFFNTLLRQSQQRV